MQARVHGGISPQDPLTGEDAVGALRCLPRRMADPTPVTDIPATDLSTYTLEDDGLPRKLTSHGVRWRGHTYVAP
ncbi:hypothetical protein GCM10018980_74470 [Streptomyces capoamus]|uniref:Uncharacterized protein n=1 Tax=Streptomyces capoamus TaxID=68183 RepID=A0A919F438_9ACTN|nr:hypothetical protein GCM10010501_75390 [Streptomyces libani subsp. rufus]GHG76491.1 hypothetical protein GCM10018980_74470 [Streptomyces capoamus]